MERSSAPAQTQLAHAVFEETGLKTVFHHHCAGYVETPDEIATLLELTNPTDARAWSSTPATIAMARGRRTATWWPRSNASALASGTYTAKTAEPEVARRARAEQWDYFTALRHGVFCELGKGCVDFPALLRRLASRGYDGYVLVEQDILARNGHTERERAPQP